MSEEKHLNERLQFAQIDAATCDQLKKLWPVIEGEIDGILDGFYRHVKAVPALGSMVGDKQNTLMSAQKAHWQKLFTAGFSPDYVESIDTIGRVHSRIGLEPRWYIGGYKFILVRLHQLVLKKYRLSPAKQDAAVDALTAAVFLDMDLAISTYQDILMEEREAQTRKLNSAIDTFKDRVETPMEALNAQAASVDEVATNLTSTCQMAQSEVTSASGVSAESSDSIQTVAAATEELTGSIQEISKQITGASKIARTATAGTETTSGQVSMLANSAQKIGDVVELIQAIAEQTNLLALNATIEAARAGDAGKGFAVVASEVKTLAGQTAKATEEISEQVGEIQQATSGAVSSIEMISEVVRELDEMTASIAAAVEEQGAATSEISGSIQSVANGAGVLLKNIESVDQAIGETETAASRFRDAAGKLGSGSGMISEEIRTFFDQLKQAS